MSIAKNRAFLVSLAGDTTGKGEVRCGACGVS